MPLVAFRDGRAALRNGTESVPYSANFADRHDPLLRPVARLP
jgi:hypothetical protein